jgi:hypothetical protein
MPQQEMMALVLKLLTPLEQFLKSAEDGFSSFLLALRPCKMRCKMFFKNLMMV